MNVKISEMKDFYFVSVETTQGRLYYTTYTNKPTEKEVREDFRENKSSFIHQN